MSRAFGRYRLQSRLAAGGMGEVYLAAAIGPEGVERKVAIKVIRELHQQDDQIREMFIEEAKVAFLLTHANVVQTYELGEVGGEYFLAMEYVDGVTLSELLSFFRRVNQPVPLSLSLYIATEVSRGLAYAHGLESARGSPLNIVHRDVSPGNVLISVDGQVKIADFGLAKSAIRAVESEAGVVKGKLAYMAPEQVLAGDVDQRCDIYALGLMIYEMVAGAHPFGDPRKIDYQARVGGIAIPALSLAMPALDVALVALVSRCIAEDRSARPETAKEVSRTLDRIHRQGRFTSSGEEELAEVVRQIKVEQQKKARQSPFDQALAIELSRAEGQGAGPSTYVASAPLPSDGMPAAPVEVETLVEGATSTPTRTSIGVPSRRLLQWSVVSSFIGLALGGGLWMALSGSGDTGAAIVPPASDAARRETTERAKPDALVPRDLANARATLSIRPWPAGGEVWVGGRVRGTAPLSLTGLPPGPVEVRIVRAGRRPYRQIVTLEAGATLTLSPRLSLARPRAPAGRGTLSVNSDPWSIVFVDGRRVRGTPLIGHALPVGRHRIVLINRQRKLKATREVLIRAGKTTTLVVELRKR